MRFSNLIIYQFTLKYQVKNFCRTQPNEHIKSKGWIT